VSHLCWHRGEKDPKRFVRYFETFLALHREVAVETGDDGINALVAFLERWSPSHAASLPGWEAISDSNLVFRLEEDSKYLHERPMLRDAWLRRFESGFDGPTAWCLVTGERGSVATLHPPVKGLSSVQAPLVSFNENAYESYGKSKSINAPVSERAAFAYSTALNHLLRTGSRQRIRIGDATTVFWAERAMKGEDLLAALFNPPQEANTERPHESLEDPARTALVREVLKAAKDGRPLSEVDASLDPDVRFYVLGLSPNKARLAVRFWNVSTFGQLIEHLGRHFCAMEVERQFEGDLEYPPFWQILLETALLRESKNVPPLLVGALTRAILTGLPYPRSLFTAILGRIRADRVVNYLRAAILKACLVRNYQMEVPMSLDVERREPAYRLGRLFALLEKAQKDATNPTATIRDRYFGAASATPAAVFPQLLRLGQHHISNPKAEYGGYTDKLIAEVMDGIDELPKHLSLEEQGLFTLGYYHQRNALYRKGDKE
jgi:CRISPR-associated protein Csd1